MRGKLQSRRDDLHRPDTYIGLLGRQFRKVIPSRNAGRHVNIDNQLFCAASSFRKREWKTADGLGNLQYTTLESPAHSLDKNGGPCHDLRLVGFLSAVIHRANEHSCGTHIPMWQKQKPTQHHSGARSPLRQCSPRVCEKHDFQ